MMLLSNIAAAQSQYVEAPTIRYIHKHTKVLEISGWYFNDYYALSGRFNRTFDLRGDKKFYLGASLMFKPSFSNNPYFVTAPVRKNRAGNSIFSFLQPVNTSLLDTIFIDNSLTTPANLAIMFHYNITRKLEVGYSLELFGVGFGSIKDVTVQSTSVDSSLAQQKVLPAVLNIWFPGDLRRGNLGAEVFFRYWLNHKWGFHLSGSFAYREFQLIDFTVNGTNRFRQKVLHAGFGISYAPFH
jgi:hypothetical protein